MTVRTMRCTRYIILLAIAVAGIFGFALALLFSGEQKSEKLESYSGLQRSESWRKGWVPMLIPETAKNIYVEHDVDTNYVYGEFSAPSFSLEQDVVGLRKLTVDEKSRLLNSMPVFGVRSRIGKKAVFSWCDKSEGMSVYLFTPEEGHVIYWGSSSVAC